MTKLLKLSRASAAARNLTKPDRRLPVAKLLVPVDFSAAAKGTLSYAAAFARQIGASVTLLHVIKPICEIDFGYGSVVRRCQSRAVVDHVKTRLNALGKRWTGLHCRARVLVRTGTAENEIVAAARQLETDLIFLGTPGVSHPPGTSLSSITEHVVRYAPCSVLIVRNKYPVCASNRKSRQLCLQKHM